MLSNIQAIVVTSSTLPKLVPNKIKLVEKICGQEIIMYPLAALHKLSLPITVMHSTQEVTLKDTTNQRYPDLEFIEYTQPHDIIKRITSRLYEHILIMPAHLPLIAPTMIEDLYHHHTVTNAAISFIAAHHEEPIDSYKHVIKKKKKIYIRDYKELNATEQQESCCITSGIYIISRTFLAKYIDTISQDKFTTESFFVDLVNKATDLENNVGITFAPFDHIRRAHTYQEIWAIEQIKRAELIRFWMNQGVRFSAAQNVHIDVDVEIGTESFIGNGVHLLRGTKIGTNATIDAFSIIEHASLGNHVMVHSHSIIKDSTIGDHTQIGPFAHIQSDTTIGTHCAIGNFVETKRSIIGNNSKAKHLTYLGDAHIGSQVNIGAGTITCNYNGKTKHTTHIEDNVFIGSNNSLVAPVTIEKEAFTAAGSVITQNVPAQALAIARARQVNKEGYARTLQEPVSPENSEEDIKQSLSFVGATKSSSIDL